jgi:hypothetical protein
MRKLVETGVNFAHFRARPCGQTQLFGAGCLARFFARGLPQVLTGGFSRLRFLAATSRFAGFRVTTLLFLVPGARSGSRRFADARRVPIRIAIRVTILVSILVGLEIPSAIRATILGAFLGAIPAPGPFPAFAAPRFHIVELGAAAGFAARRIIRFALGIAIGIAAKSAVVIGVTRALAVILIFGSDDVVEPFADRHAGLARGVAGGFTRFWAEASQIPRTARFHCAPKKSHREEQMALLFELCGSVTDEAEGAVSSEPDFSGIE